MLRDGTVGPRMRVGVRRMARRAGVDLVRVRPALPELIGRRFATVVDVGANVGQFGRELRDWGYGGRLVSFEPVPDAYRALARRARRDGNWIALPFALGDRDGEATLLISPDTVFSSLRGMGAALRRRFPAAQDVREVRVPVRRLDSVWRELGVGQGPVLLKSDTQGYEREVLVGAAGVVDALDGVLVELSVEPQYDGEAPMMEMLRVMEELGFTLSGIEPVTHDPPSGRLLQVDALFLRPASGPGRSATDG